MLLGRDANVLAAWLLRAGDEIGHAARASGLSPGEVAALVLVSNDPGRSMDWLRARLGLSHSGAVRLVDRLAAQQLLERSAGRRDARTVSLTLTARAGQLVEQVHAARSEVIERLVADLPADQVATLVQLADRQLRDLPRDRVAADMTCRLCDYRACVPACPVDASIADVDTDARQDGGREAGDR